MALLGTLWRKNKTPLPISPPATVLIASSPRPPFHRIRRLLSLIQLHYQGRSWDNTWKRVRISPDEYQALQDTLEKDTRLGAWVVDKLRYDYDSVVPENFRSSALASREREERYSYSYCPLRFSIFHPHILLQRKWLQSPPKTLTSPASFRNPATKT